MAKLDINLLLVSQHPNRSQQFIISVFALWAEREYKKHSGKFDKIDACGRYLKALSHSLNTRLLLQSSQAHSRTKQKLLNVSQVTFTKKKHEIVSLMEGMSPDDAVAFLADITATWCFSMPENFIPLMPITPRDRSDKSFADAIDEWFVKYFDMWI